MQFINVSMPNYVKLPNINMQIIYKKMNFVVRGNFIITCISLIIFQLNKYKIKC